jgi:hypothetical protein
MNMLSKYSIHFIHSFKFVYTQLAKILPYSGISTHGHFGTDSRRIDHDSWLPGDQSLSHCHCDCTGRVGPSNLLISKLIYFLLGHNILDNAIIIGMYGITEHFIRLLLFMLDSKLTLTY